MVRLHLVAGSVTDGTKVVDGTVVINPAFLTKGMYAMLRAKGQAGSSAAQDIQVELIKLND
jgi:Icc-related predicted phosphoesterase